MYGSVDAFTRALLAARSIAYLHEGPSGVDPGGVLERLGIAEQVRRERDGQGAGCSPGAHPLRTPRGVEVIEARRMRPE